MALGLSPSEKDLNEVIQTYTIQAASGKSFILTERLKVWLSSRCEGLGSKTHLENIFDSIFGSKSAESQEFVSLEQNSVLICILLQIGLGHLIASFKNYGISDESLPISREELTSISSELGVSQTKVVVDFFEFQWRFHPAVFELERDEQWPVEMVIPIHCQTLIAEGRTAKVYEISIPEDFVGPRLRRAAPTSRYKDPDVGWCYQFVWKTFNGWNAPSGKREMAIFTVLKSHERLLRPLAAFSSVDDQAMTNSTDNIASGNAYNIIFQRCDLDLGEYFASSLPPIKRHEIEDFWKNLCGIVDALQFMHKPHVKFSTEIGEPTEHIGYHHDIKPSNILLSDGKFKISDFGFASFVPMNHQPISSSAASGTVSYGPPEPNLYTSNPTLESLQKFDLWSLGCVFSEAATWIVLGKAGIDRFQTIRRQDLNRLYNELTSEYESTKTVSLGDYFHDGTDVLAGVASWHRHLQMNLRASDGITSKILDIVDRRLLIKDIPARIDAKALSIEMRHIFEESEAGNDLPFLAGTNRSQDQDNKHKKDDKATLGDEMGR